MDPTVPQNLHSPPQVAWSERLPEQVVLYGNDGALIEADLKRLGARVVGVDYFGPLEETPRPELLGERGMIIHPSGVKELINNIHRLPQGLGMVRLASGDDLVDNTRVVASLRLPVDLLYNRAELRGEQGTQLVEHYLHHQALQAPIEPFHTILAFMLESRNLDLWDLARYNPDRYLFADGEGNLAASYNDLAAGRILGSIFDEPSTWRQSSARRELDEYLASLPRRQTQCLSCHFFFFCRGFLRFVAKSCQAWQHAFNRLLTAVEEIAQARAQWQTLAGQDPAGRASA